MYRRAVVGLAATGLLMMGCGPATQPSSSPATHEPSAPPRSEEAGEETLRRWADALRTGHGASGCAVLTPSYEKHLIKEAVAWEYVPAGASCEDAVAATGAAQLDLGLTLRVERITRTHELKDDRAYFEVQWVESEEGDGSGFTLVWRDGRYLITQR